MQHDTPTNRIVLMGERYDGLDCGWCTFPGRVAIWASGEVTARMDGGKDGWLLYVGTYDPSQIRTVLTFVECLPRDFKQQRTES